MIWAGALLLPTGMIFGLSAHGEGSWFERWGPAAIVGLPLIDQFVLDALLVVVAVYLAVRRHTAPAGQGPASATVAAGAICLGAAGGLVLWLLLLMVLQGPQPSPADLVMLTLPLLAAAVGMVTASAARPLTLILAITTLGALIYSGQYSFMQLALLATMLVLLLIALATLSGSADRPAGAIAAAGVVTAVVLTGLTRSSDPWSEVLASPRTESAVIPALTLAVVLPTLWWPPSRPSRPAGTGSGRWWRRRWRWPGRWSCCSCAARPGSSCWWSARRSASCSPPAASCTARPPSAPTPPPDPLPSAAGQIALVFPGERVLG
jgi:hypothetical protein